MNYRISILRQQQHLIVKLLKGVDNDSSMQVIDKENWVRLLCSAGMDEQAMTRWHKAFERLSPEAHQTFIESLGIPVTEVMAIRQWSHSSKPVGLSKIRAS